MINTLVIAGQLERVHISDSKRGADPSASIFLRYGDDRTFSGGAVEFIHATLIRVPPYRLKAIRDRLKEGAFVHVIGHVQGVFKNQAGQGILDTELVADRIDFVDGMNSVRNVYKKGHGRKPAAGAGAEKDGSISDDEQVEGGQDGVPAESAEIA